MKTVQTLVPATVRQSLIIPKSISEVFLSIIELKYDENQTMRIIKYLNSLRLTQFLTIEEYSENIQVTLEILKLNNNYTLKKLEHKEKESIFNRLNDQIAT